MANIRKIKFEMPVCAIHPIFNIFENHEYFIFVSIQNFSFFFYRPDTKDQTKSNESFGGQQCIVPSLGKRVSVK